MSEKKKYIVSIYRFERCLLNIEAESHFEAMEKVGEQEGIKTGSQYWMTAQKQKD